MNTQGLEAHGLACTLGNRTLFQSLELAVGPGHWLMLTGANGSGKSTLLRILAGLVVPTAGEVRWNGQACRAGDPRWNARFVYQGHATGWKDQLTARENLAMQARIDVPGIGPADANDAADRAILRLGLGRQRNLPFSRLSAGQRRRLGLARLSLGSRPLWLLDEPTTALDVDGQQRFAELLDDHLVNGGCAAIATHLDFPTQSPAIALRLGSA